MTDAVKLLVVEDQEDDHVLLLRHLQLAGLAVRSARVTSADGLRGALAAETWDVVIATYSLPGLSGLEALDLVRDSGSAAPFVLVSGPIGEEGLVEAMRRGADDCVRKDRLARLAPVVRRLVAERRRRSGLEAQLRQARRLEAVGRLAGGLAHDFNNLLTVIQNFTLFARDRLEAGHRSRAELDAVLDAARRAAALTRQLLTFARAQPGIPRVVDVNDSVRDLDRMLQCLLGEDVVLEVRAAAAPSLVRIDPGQLEQVLLHLVINARDAMPQGGRLRIEVADPGGEDPGPDVRIVVADEGKGMAPAVLEHAFEPFFTTKAGGEGAGLGLATCHDIVSQAGGTIRAQSEPGVGTSVEARLPRAAVGPAATPAPAAALPETLPTGDEAVLVVEDDDALREIVVRILSGQGFRVLEAAGPSAALAVHEAARAPVDLLLCDVVMPGGGGRDVAEALSVRQPGLRTLYMSGYAADAVVRRGLVAGEMRLLSKPFTPAELLARVREVLAEPRAEASSEGGEPC